MQKQKEFEILVTGLALAHKHFSLHQIIAQELKNKNHEKDKFLWDVIQLGLEQSYLTGLARFFERPKDLDETISIYYFFDFGHNEIINKLKKIRNKMISHHDKNLSKSSFLEELRLDNEDVKLLFKIATESVEKLKKDFGYIYNDHVITGFELDKLILESELKGWLKKLYSDN